MCIFHNYTRWGVPTDSYRAKVKQARVCRTCGKVQVRSIGYEDGVYSKGIIKSLGELIIYCRVGDIESYKEKEQ